MRRGFSGTRSASVDDDTQTCAEGYEIRDAIAWSGVPGIVRCGADGGGWGGRDGRGAEAVPVIIISIIIIRTGFRIWTVGGKEREDV